VAIGFNRETGGGWSETLLAHFSQLWKLPDSVSSEDAVLLDPAATALAALLRTAVSAPQRTLIVGGGTIGLLAAYLHLRLGLPGDCELLVKRDFQRDWAHRHGLKASVARTDGEFRTWASDRSMQSVSVTGYGPIYRGMYDRVIVAADTLSALRWSLQAAAARGTVALVAAPDNLPNIDPTPIWYREISIQGIYAYGPVSWEGKWVHPYAVLVPRLADGTLLLRELITHEFPLGQYVSAFSAMLHRGNSHAIKILLRPSKRGVE
jgi:threonine dehydrogenase-like Zn-dependent dehydrogenase